MFSIDVEHVSGVAAENLACVVTRTWLRVFDPVCRGVTKQFSVKCSGRNVEHVCFQFLEFSYIGIVMDNPQKKVIQHLFLPVLTASMMHIIFFFFITLHRRGEDERRRNG